MKPVDLASAGAAFFALGAIATAPAAAALLEIDFETESGGTGSFIFNTDVAPDSEPARLIFEDGSIEEGLNYTSAISEFTFSSSEITFSNLAGDYSVFPSLPFAEDSAGVLSLLGGPPGCGSATDFFCSVDFGLEYLGSISELPVLSNEPSAYPRADIIAFIDSQTGDLISLDPVTSLEVETVPESTSILSLLVISLGGASWLRRRGAF